MSELSKLLNQYGLTTATPALYAGATMPSAPVAPTDTTDTAAASKYAEQQAQYNTNMANYNANGASDQAAYKQYLDNYNNRIQYTPQYTDAQYRINPSGTSIQGGNQNTGIPSYMQPRNTATTGGFDENWYLNQKLKQLSSDPTAAATGLAPRRLAAEPCVSWLSVCSAKSACTCAASCPGFTSANW